MKYLAAFGLVMNTMIFFDATIHNMSMGVQVSSMVGASLSTVALMYYWPKR